MQNKSTQFSVLISFSLLRTPLLLISALSFTFFSFVFLIRKTPVIGENAPFTRVLLFTKFALRLVTSHLFCELLKRSLALLPYPIRVFARISGNFRPLECRRRFQLSIFLFGFPPNPFYLQPGNSYKTLCYLLLHIRQLIQRIRINIQACSTVSVSLKIPRKRII